MPRIGNDRNNTHLAGIAPDSSGNPRTDDAESCSSADRDSCQTQVLDGFNDLILESTQVLGLLSTPLFASSRRRVEPSILKDNPVIDLSLQEYLIMLK